MPIKFTGVKSGYAYRWPDGSVENFDVIIYDAIFSDQKHEIKIGFTDREAFGRIRKRVIVFVDGYPEAEFAEADDYGQTGHLVAMIRKPDGKFMDINNIDSEYVGLPVVEHSKHIDKNLGGRVGTAALVVTGDDHKTMIKHALIQSKWRRARKT